MRMWLQIKWTQTPGLLKESLLFSTSSTHEGGTWLKVPEVLQVRIPAEKSVWSTLCHIVFDLTVTSVFPLTTLFNPYYFLLLLLFTLYFTRVLSQSIGLKGLACFTVSGSQSEPATVGLSLCSHRVHFLFMWLNNERSVRTGWTRWTKHDRFIRNTITFQTKVKAAQWQSRSAASLLSTVFLTC